MDVSRKPDGHEHTDLLVQVETHVTFLPSLPSTHALTWCPTALVLLRTSLWENQQLAVTVAFVEPVDLKYHHPNESFYQV